MSQISPVYPASHIHVTLHSPCKQSGTHSGSKTEHYKYILKLNNQTQ